MAQPLSTKSAAILGCQNFVRDVQTWRRLCSDGTRALAAQHPIEDGKPVEAETVSAQDLLYITIERELVAKLRTSSIEEFERFQRLNFELVPKVLFLSEPQKSVVESLEKYHHFFDSLLQGEPLVAKRHATLQEHAEIGDRINATFKDDGAAQVRRFRRILLTRKRLFLDGLLLGWQQGFESPDKQERTFTHWASVAMKGGAGGLGESLLQVQPTWLFRMRRFVSDHMDYDYGWMRNFMRSAHEDVPVLLKAPAVVGSTLSRYREAVKNLNSIDKDLERLLKNAGSFERLSAGDLDKFNELHAEMLVNQQIADVSARQMPLLSTIGKNITDFSYGQAALQAVLLIGQSSALAALDGIKNSMSGQGHRVDWNEVGKETLIDLAQVGGMIAVTLLFGPTAGAGAAGLIGKLFRGKEPDQHEERFKALDKKLDRILDRINALEDTVMARLNALPGQIRSVVVEERFRDAVASLSSQFSNIQRRYEEVFTGRQRHLYGVDLHSEIQAMRDNLQSVVRALWCDGFVLDPRLVTEQLAIRARNIPGHIPVEPLLPAGKKPPPQPELLQPSAGSVIATLIRGANHEGHAQRFEQTVELIHALAQLVAELGSAYSGVVEHLLSLLGASLVLPGATNPEAAFAQARDLDQIVEEDLRVLLWAGAELWRSPGERNMQLYSQTAMCREDWKNLDPFRGFFLVNGRGIWTFKTSEGDSSRTTPKVVWETGRDDPDSQLFIVPDGGSADHPYTFVTPSADRQVAKARLALGAGDTLWLHADKKIERVHVNVLGGDGFDRRFELYTHIRHGLHRSGYSLQSKLIDMFRVALPGPSSSWLTFICDHTGLNAKVEIHIDVRQHSTDPPKKTIPLLNIDLKTGELGQAHKEDRIAWMIGRAETETGSTGPAYVGLGIVEKPDEKHAQPWGRLVEVFKLDPKSAINLVPSEGAYDIPVSFKDGDRTVTVLFDNLTPFLPKGYLLRGQSLPAGGYLMDERALNTLVAQSDRHLVQYYEESRGKENWVWRSGYFSSGQKDGGSLTLTTNGRLEQRTKDGKLWWSAGLYDAKRGSSWKLFESDEATRLIVGHRTKMLNARGQECFVFDDGQIKAVKKISDLS